MSEKLKPCAACEEPTEGAWHFGSSIGPRHVPCCEACAVSGKMKRWLLVAFKVWAESRVAFSSSGDFMTDHHQLLLHLKHNARLADGVCPNGCALMVPLDGSDRDGHCPSCGFVQHSNVPLVFINE